MVGFYKHLTLRYDKLKPNHKIETFYIIAVALNSSPLDNDSNIFSKINPQDLV